MSSYIRVDPLTLYVGGEVTDSARKEIYDIIKKIIKEESENAAKCSEDIYACGDFLNRVADRIVNEIYEEYEEYYRSSIYGENPKRKITFVITPADNRFPGFVNSLGDHMITTATFATAAALAYYDYDCGELKAYGIDFSLNRELLRGFVRVASLLHDAGKPPFKGHSQRTKDIVYSLFKDISERLAYALSEASYRHHYGESYPDKPRTFIEWIVAYADKASACSRAFLIKDDKKFFKNLINFAKRLQKHYDIGGDEYISKIENSVSELSEDDEDLTTYGLLSPDENKAIDLAKELINAENRLCNGNKRLLALLYFEIPSIKSYLNRGRKLSVYSGYSMMIDSLIHEVSDFIKRKIGREAIISDEGGSLLAIVPSTFSINDIVTEPTIKELIGMFDSYKYIFMEFKFAEAHLGPEENWKNWGDKDPLERDSLRSFGALLNKFFAMAEEIVILKNKSKIPLTKICKECRINDAKNNDFCESCEMANKFYDAFRKMARRLDESSISEKIKKLRIYKIIDDLKKSDKEMEIILWKSVDDLGTDLEDHKVELDKRRFPVLTIGDGDNFGKLKSSATTLTHYLEINRYFTYMIYYSVSYALEKTSKVYKLSKEKTIEFQPILLGGDDFSIILASQELLPFLYYFDEALNKIGGRLMKNGTTKPDSISDEVKAKRPYLWFGISIGAYIYKNTAYPIFLAREHAEEIMLNVSKKVSKLVYQTAYNGSGAIITITDDKSFGLLELFKKNGLTIIGSNIKSILEDILSLERININSRKIFDLIKFKDDGISILYSAARNNPDSLKEISRIVSQRFGGKDTNLFGYFVLLGTLMESLEQKNLDDKKYYELSEWLIKGDVDMDPLR